MLNTIMAVVPFARVAFGMFALRGPTINEAA
jgi:hypothetical protein